MSTLVNELERLIQCHAKLDRLVPQYLKTGLSRETILSLLTDVGTPTTELVELYTWHDGMLAAGVRPGDVELFPGYEWLSLQRAVSSYRSWVKASEQSAVYGEPMPPDYWRKGWLPLFDGMGGSYFAVSCAPHEEEYGAVVWISPGNRTEVAFPSIKGMIRSLAACFEAEAYGLDSDGLLEEADELSWPIFRELNPSARAWRK